MILFVHLIETTLLDFAISGRIKLTNIKFIRNKIILLLIVNPNNIRDVTRVLQIGIPHGDCPAWGPKNGDFFPAGTEMGVNFFL